MSEFTKIDRVLNMYHTIHSARSLCKLMSIYWEISVFRTGQRSKMESFGEIITLFNYFQKIWNLWESSECVSDFKSVIVLNIRKVMLIWQGSEYVSEWNYGTILNIPEFRICQVSAWVSVAHGSGYAWIWLNHALWQVLNIPGQHLNKPRVLIMLRFRIWQGC